jgi:hypothetical protein
LLICILKPCGLKICSEKRNAFRFLIILVSKNCTLDPFNCLNVSFEIISNLGT